MQNDLMQKQSVEIRQTLENLRETMCLTSGKLFINKPIGERKSLEKINESAVIDDKPKDKKEKQFKIRVNSFHRTKKDELFDDS